MSLHVYFQERDFSAGKEIGNLNYRVNSMSWNYIGGCKAANITASGDSLSLWELIECLRCPVLIEDDLGQRAWWGVVSEIRVKVGRWEIGVSLDKMGNSVAVAYSYVEAGTTNVGTRKTTAWATDADSILTYGQKDLLISANGMTDAAAIQERDTELYKWKYPQGTANPFAKEAAISSATIICSGWFETLKWRIASVATSASIETTTQIANLVTTYGQFLTATDIAAGSGLSTSEYRSGDNTAYYEITALMKAGGANKRPLLANVTFDRRLQIYEEPASSPVSYFVNNNLQILTSGDTPTPGYVPPVGNWVRIADVIPGSVDITKLADPTLQFLEEATYSSNNGLLPKFRGQV